MRRRPPQDGGAAGGRRRAGPRYSFVNFTSEGVILIYGRDEHAIAAANLLEDHLDVTVLIKPPAEVAPPRVTDFPVVKGTIRAAKGHLGAFELTVDGYAQPAPSSRGALVFATPRDGAVSSCDVVLDLSGGAPLFTASDLRDGYLRADPADPAAVLRAVLKARDLSAASTSALRHLQRRPLRPFALGDRRLHALPRSLSDRGDRARRQPRRHRRPRLCWLRPMRRGSARPALPNMRCRRPTPCCAGCAPC